MRFYINILSTYYPDLDPPYDVYYQQILEQIELAEELGWECFMFNEHHFLGYGGLVANPAVLLAIVLGSGGVYFPRARFLLPAFPLLLPLALHLSRASRRYRALVLTVAVAGSVYGGAYMALVWSRAP